MEVNEMDPIMMSQLVEAIQDDRIQETEKQRFLKTWQAGNDRGTMKIWKFGLALPVVVGLLFAWLSIAF